jgi:hypothetical protein
MEAIKAHGKSVALGVNYGEQRTSITDGFFVTAKPYETTSYAVPDDVKKPYKKHGRAVRVTIKPIGQKDEEE